MPLPPAVLRMLVAFLGVSIIATAVIIAEAMAAFPARPDSLGSATPVQVGEAKGAVELECGGSWPGQQVAWKVVDKPWVTLAPPGPGNRRLHIADLDVSSSGNYTCWAGPRLLHSTLLAVRDPAFPLFRRKAGKAAAEVRCEAESYDGTFSCSWETLRRGTFRVRLHRKGQQEPGACPSSGEVAAAAAAAATAPPGPVRLPLQDCSFCPFAEALQGPLQVELEGVGEDGSYEALTRELFLPDIVKPASPDHLVARRGSRSLNLSWMPPASWPLPSTYFPLHYHLRLQPFGTGVEQDVLSDKLQETREEEELIQRVQIRCQDPIINSAWSPWSAWVPVQ